MKSFENEWGLSEAQLREFYGTEVELAARLRHASKQERLRLYRELYDELFRRVPFHPQLTRKVSSEETASAVATQMRFIGRFLSAGSTYLEIGAGDCALAVRVAEQVKKVIAVEVSDIISMRQDKPANLELVLSDGTSMPVPRSSVDVAFSNQLMEHLHPDDALAQLKNVYAVLVPDGKYVCITPNRLTGPWDVSRFFDDEATGFHLKEYTYQELSSLFQEVGFSSVVAYLGYPAKGVYMKTPMSVACFLERSCQMAVAGRLGDDRRRITNTMAFRVIRGIRIVGIK